RPEPSQMASFTDMTGNTEFDKAISWAAENGITTGWSDGTFRPWNTCNRASIVTFLWRFAGRPEPEGENTFSDKTGDPEFDLAIAWAAGNGITTGWSDGTFRPWNTCNRLAVVSFLYRYAHPQG
ncbi:MAG: S-layer homology domain-containing protein, partial [Lachnospiraceae bacterium]|nr:S-layer homology domain-containing protein [Lachnospiraceae bacterium]